MRSFLIALLLVSVSSAQDRPLPDFDTFSAQVKKHLATDEERQRSEEHTSELQSQ